LNIIDYKYITKKSINQERISNWCNDLLFLMDYSFVHCVYMKKAG
jgi:hypothetical protein